MREQSFPLDEHRASTPAAHEEGPVQHVKIVPSDAKPLRSIAPQVGDVIFKQPTVKRC